MLDEDIQGARRKASTPLERFMLTIEQARTGQFGLAYCRDDDEINAAAREGRKITSKLLQGDVVFCEVKDPKTPWSATRNNTPFIGVITAQNAEAGDLRDLAEVLPIDLLGGTAAPEYTWFHRLGGLHRFKITVWFREGRPCT